MLNEDDSKKIFWPAEDKFKEIGKKFGDVLKIFVVNDCCREDMIKLRKSIETKEETSAREALEKAKEKQIAEEKERKHKTNNLYNLFRIYGSTEGENVAAKSGLALELNQHLTNKSMNLRSEVNVPGDFVDFKPCGGKGQVVLDTDYYSIGFGKQKWSDRD